MYAMMNMTNRVELTDDELDLVIGGASTSYAMAYVQEDTNNTEKKTKKVFTNVNDTKKPVSPVTIPTSDPDC